MEFKGTKGEWKVKKAKMRFPSASKWQIINENEDALFEVELAESDEAMQANAKLIASAPDLLEALTMLIEETEDYVNETACGNTYLDIAREKARKAIEKALL